MHVDKITEYDNYVGVPCMHVPCGRGVVTLKLIQYIHRKGGGRRRTKL